MKKIFLFGLVLLLCSGISFADSIMMNVTVTAPVSPITGFVIGSTTLSLVPFILIAGLLLFILRGFYTESISTDRIIEIMVVALIVIGLIGAVILAV